MGKIYEQTFLQGREMHMMSLVLRKRQSASQWHSAPQSPGRLSSQRQTGVGEGEGQLGLWNSAVRAVQYYWQVKESISVSQNVKQRLSIGPSNSTSVHLTPKEKRTSQQSIHEHSGHRHSQQLKSINNLNIHRRLSRLTMWGASNQCRTNRWRAGSFHTMGGLENSTPSERNPVALAPIVRDSVYTTCAEHTLHRDA